MNGEVRYLISASADISYPVVPYFGLLWTDETNSLSIPLIQPIYGEWGTLMSDSIPLIDVNPLPVRISTCWLSVTEEKFYFIEDVLDQEKIIKTYNLLQENNDDDIYMVIGFGPSGRCVLWVRNNLKSIMVYNQEGKECNLPMSDFLPVRPDLSKHDFCRQMIKGLPDFKYPEYNYSYKWKKNLTQHYTYKFNLSFNHSSERSKDLNLETDISDFYKVSVWRFDGTFDKSNDGSITNFYGAHSKPKKITIKWCVGKTEYKIHFRLEEQQITEIFEKFYGTHPQTKTDFIIRIDTENKKYELALYRQGLKEPVVIPESAYQVIVFKNKFENYRSENYNQPRGAWIW